MPRLLIVEESLRDLKAHWFDYIHTISHAAGQLGWNVSVACHEKADPLIKSKLECHPVFKQARYLDNFVESSFSKRLISPIVHSWRMLNVLRPLLNSKPPYDMVFAPTVLLHHLLCWWVIVVFSSKHVKKLTLFFVTNPGIWNGTTKRGVIPRSSFFLKVLLKLFSTHVKSGKVRFAVETVGAKQEFESISGLPFILMPHPVHFALQKESKPAEDSFSNVTTFSCLGFARHEKGSDLLKTAIEKIVTTEKSFDGRFIIQWTDKFKMPDGSICEPGLLLSSHPKVEIIDRAVLPDEYERLLQRTDSMILPYRNSSYYARVSRIAIECVCLGIPVIYTKGGWLEEIMADYGNGIGIEDESPEALIEAILQLSKSKNGWGRGRYEKTSRAVTYYSHANFCRLLLNTNTD